MSETATSPAEPAAAPPVMKGRGPGVAALVLGLLAVLGDALALALTVSAIGAAGAVDSIEGAFAVIGGALLVVLAAFFGGILLALIGLVLGLVGMVRGRGRVAGVIGGLLSLGVLVAHIGLLVVISTGADALSQVLGGLV
jgi:hypothetical protein